MLEIWKIQGIPIWRNVVVLQWVSQIVSAIVVLSIIGFLVVNVLGEIDDRDLPVGFRFLDESPGIPIGEHAIDFDPSRSYQYGLLVAALNTIKAAFLGVVLATILGAIVGIARISPNWLLSKIALAYIEIFRNVPLLVQLLFWFLIILSLPNVRESYSAFDLIYLNNSGVYMPWFNPQSGFWAWVTVTALGVVLAIFVARRLNRREIETGSASYPVISAIAVATAITLIGYAALTPFDVIVPEAQGRFGRFAGGAKLTGSFFALLTGLVVYTSSFVAEIVRAGIQAVRRGQIEAARSLGLSTAQTLRHVTFPQALRVIIPPMISQYLNLTKNSSLAAAIGYPDLVSVASTMTQTAPAISLIAIVMVTYLALSLFYSLVGNIYNRLTEFRAI